MGSGKISVKGKIKARVGKAPVKAGSTHPKNIGGILNAKVIAIHNKIKGK